MNRDELEGRAKALKGKIKQATGDLTNNPRLHDESAVDEVAGKAQGAVGRIRAQGRRRHRGRRQRHEEMGVGCDILATLRWRSARSRPDHLLILWR
jgi:uncharacterized protein YjbJ (UPF0337 family)